MRSFLDTNVLVYAFAKNDTRAAAAETLLASGGFCSVQVLNEFVAVMSRKLHMPWREILAALNAIRTLLEKPEAITIETHERALWIAARHGYHIFDSLVIASALAASCSVLYTEDLQDGQNIEGLMIRNPFRIRET